MRSLCRRRRRVHLLCLQRRYKARSWMRLRRCSSRCKSFSRSTTCCFSRFLPQPPEQLPAASAAVTPKPEAAKPLEPPAALQPPAPKASAPAPPQPLEEPNLQVSEGEIAKVFDLDNKATWHSRSCFFPLLFNFSFPSLLLSFPFASLPRREFLKQE